MKKAKIVFLLLPLLLWAGLRMYKIVVWDINCGGHIKRAADSNTPELATQDLFLPCHGGITLSAPAVRGPFKGHWILGFDCGHAWDLCPYNEHHSVDQVYRTFEYTQRVTNNLCDLIRDWAPRVRVVG